VDVCEDVAGLNARRRRRADDAGDLNGPTVDTVSACTRRRQRHRIHQYPEVTPYYAAVLDELLRHSPNEIDGNRKADTLGRAFAAALGHCGVDADQLAARVHEGAAGVARIDRGVCLDEVLVLGEAEAPADRADDAERDRLAQAERVADRKHDVPDRQRVRAQL